MKSNKQVALIVKEDGLIYLRSDTGEEVLCADQEKAKALLSEHHFFNAYTPDRFRIPGIYPIPDLQWEVKTIMSDGWQPTYNNPDNSGCEQPAEPIEVAILKESTPSEPKIPLNYAQRAVRDETGKVIRFEPFDKARLKEALKEVKAKNKEIRDSYQADNETMSFRAAKESTPLTEQESQDELWKQARHLIEIWDIDGLFKQFIITRKP